ncbi:unnamed protein product [Tenebrio molitor]|nr:unnamed protein product [Tenebrio molitor]
MMFSQNLRDLKILANSLFWSIKNYNCPKSQVLNCHLHLAPKILQHCGGARGDIFA